MLINVKFFNVIRRMLALGMTWALLGALIGGNCDALVRGDRIGVFCSVVAWMIVMAIAGAMLSLFGGRPRGAVIGAGIGFTIAMGACLATGIISQMHLNIGILVGAIIAATLYPWIRM